MVLAKDHEANALELRKAGATYKAIGKQIGLTAEGARKCVVRALAELKSVCTERAEEVRQIEAERLDAMTLGLWDKARRGDVAAVQACLKVMERRAKLLGLETIDDADDGDEPIRGFTYETTAGEAVPVRGRGE